jgi:PIN domain nuclease of toxin-antitoxin system
MKYILDTHTLIWFLEDNQKLSFYAKNAIENSQNQCFVSIVSLWEIAVKVSLGKLVLRYGFSELSNFINKSNIEILPIEFEHLQQLHQLDYHHKDPFDRLLIAQAQSEKMIFITKDENFDKYKIQILW